MENVRLLQYLWLNMALGAGSTVPKKLIRHFGMDIAQLFCAEEQEYLAAGVPETYLDVLADKDLDAAKRALHFCGANGVGILCFSDREYPDRLRAIANPPPVLYYKGKLKRLDDEVLITMVGTRTCSDRGLSTAYHLAYGVAKAGGVVVNGLAVGIDGACIRGALDADGYAVGILGCGIDKIYPEENADLFDRLYQDGLILTEFPPFSNPSGKHFPIRNRILSGISLATVVLEADLASGALITAKHALEQGRKIFALPGDIADPHFTGPNELIKNGAYVVTNPEDILSEYLFLYPHRINENALRHPEQIVFPSQKFSSMPKRDKKAAPKQYSGRAAKSAQAVLEEKNAQSKQREDRIAVLNDTERAVYLALPDDVPTAPDELILDGFLPEDVIGAFTLLEIYGLIEAVPGGRYRKISGSSSDALPS